jgi:hypothetical protein
MLPMSLDCFICLHPVPCVPNVTDVSGLFYLSLSCVLCAQCYRCLWIVLFVFILCPVCPMLLMSLDCFICLHPVSCVPNVTDVSGLFILDYLCFFLMVIYIHLADSVIRVVDSTKVCRHV